MTGIELRAAAWAPKSFNRQRTYHDHRHAHPNADAHIAASVASTAAAAAAGHRPIHHDASARPVRFIGVHGGFGSLQHDTHATHEGEPCNVLK